MSAAGTTTSRSNVALAVAAALTSALALGALVLWVSEALCDEVCEARPWEVNWQVVVTVAALAAAAATTVCAVTGRRRPALTFLLLAVALTWPVVLDVAADGLSHSPLPF
jgi:hypothetical protein